VGLAGGVVFALPGRVGDGAAWLGVEDGRRVGVGAAWSPARAEAATLEPKPLLGLGCGLLR
jgi:hypothetical protein